MDRGGRFLYDSNMMNRTRIPSFNLFGEHADLPDVVHCETIAARSQLHDWEFTPHRHARLHQVLLLRAGAGMVTLDGAEHALSAMVLVNVPTGVVHGYSFAPGTDGLVVTFAAEMLDQSLHPSEGLRPVLGRAAVLADPQARLVGCMDQIAETFATRDFARAQMLRALVALLLGMIAGAAMRRAPDDTAAEPAILTRFQNLLDEKFVQHWSVADYARALAISPTHLTRLTRAATGQPASALIEERLVREARRNLVYTNLSVSRIAYSLGFDDPAYFTRVFTRATGLSPRAFRQRLDGGGG